MLPIPPRSEQDQIVRFLDWKVSKINQLIAVKKKQMHELTDLKSISIRKIVFHGINKNAILKSCNIRWIDKIPRHWNFSKVKYHFLIENGSDPTLPGEIPVYGSGAESFKSCGEYKTGPTVLLGRKGATLHIPHFIKGKYWNVDTAFNTVPQKKGKIIIEYFYYLAMFFDYDYFKTQTTLPSMTQFDYKNILIPIPPIDEQIAIVKTIKQKAETFDKALCNLTEEIKELSNLKCRLISDVVTGQINVHDIEIPNYKYFDEGSSIEYKNENVNDFTEQKEPQNYE